MEYSMRRGRVSKSLLCQWSPSKASFLVIGEYCAKGSVQGQENLAGTEYLVFKEN